jgi:hypothetical protein
MKHIALIDFGFSHDDRDLSAVGYSDKPARALLASFCIGGTNAVPAGAIATGSECEAFRRWIDGLTVEGNEALMQLREWGFTYELATLRRQLSRALEVRPPEEPGCRGVGRRLLELLARLQHAACFLLEEWPYGDSRSTTHPPDSTRR